MVERNSLAAYCGPLLVMVRARVASATDGAAPKMPAKLFGFSRSVKSANSDAINRR